MAAPDVGELTYRPICRVYTPRSPHPRNYGSHPGRPPNSRCSGQYAVAYRHLRRRLPVMAPTFNSTVFSDPRDQMTSSPPNQTGTAVAGYFRAKRRELMALADLPVADHSGLRGGHREQIYRTYLADILPRRYSVGRGMVYGEFHRSREADIVVWDSHSYPSLPLQDHAFYFAESVRAVIECKSNWSATEFSDVLDKARAVRDIVPHKELSLADE